MVNHPNNVSELYYRQYDATPLTPANFAGTTYGNHPKLTWTLNAEPDIAGYEVWRMILGSGSYSLLTTVNSTTNSFIDNGVELGGTIEGQVFYKIRAKDSHLPNPYYSLYTDFVKYNYSGLNKISLGTGPGIFELSDNYPNPFNPSTTISFSIPKKSFVTLKVYDVLGREVAELVNEYKTGGNYQVTFGSDNLPSGVYIFNLRAGQYFESKKMILQK